MPKITARRARADMQDYSNQRYIATLLDDGYFAALISHDSILYVQGAMDAPEVLPCGSMCNATGIWFDRSVIERGVTLKEHLRREAVMEELVKEVADDLIGENK